MSHNTYSSPNLESILHSLRHMKPGCDGITGEWYSARGQIKLRYTSRTMPLCFDSKLYWTLPQQIFISVLAVEITCSSHFTEFPKS